jgi:hypothetical protein
LIFEIGNLRLLRITIIIKMEKKVITAHFSKNDILVLEDKDEDDEDEDELAERHSGPTVSRLNKKVAVFTIEK